MELTQDYLDRLDAVQPKNLPPDLDLFELLSAHVAPALQFARFYSGGQV